jgi:heparanase 1
MNVIEEQCLVNNHGHSFLKKPLDWLRLTVQRIFAGARLLIQPRPKIDIPSHTQVLLPDPAPVHEVDPCYLSFSIDISVLAGGYWWEGSDGMRRGLGKLRVPPLNLQSPKLDRLVQALGPAYVRVGGSEADRIHYFEAPPDAKYSLVLTRQMWDELHDFVQRNQLKLFFTLKYGLEKRSLHGGWCGGAIEQLLSYSREKNYRIDVCELGNELNAYWVFHGPTAQPQAKKLAADYHTFVKVVKTAFPQTKIIGPGSAFWPRLGETLRPFSNITRPFLATCRQQGTPLDIVDWHYYPFQSQRSPLHTRRATLQNIVKPKALNEYQKYARQMRRRRDEFFPDAQLWTGETGSAQCGGQPKLSDRFASRFWWADQLGAGAITGHTVMIRQCLIGADYGLVDRLTQRPRPDYWLSWCWKRLMGQRVYRLSCSHSLLRCYCHSTPQSQGRTVLLINLSGKPLIVHHVGLGPLVRQYCLTANKLSSKRIFINGKRPHFQKGKVRLDDFPETERSQELAAYSITFRLFEGEQSK